MFYAIYEQNNETIANYYSDYKQYFKDTFSPETKILHAIDLTIHGNTYKERQASLRNIAIDWQTTWQDYCYSYGECLAWQEWFEDNAKRYGLISEFKEESII